MLRWLPLVIGLLGVSAWAAGDIDQEIRRVESILTRVAQEQQSVYQQFQMVQALRLGEERQMQPLQTYTPPATPPNYDDVKREENARAARVKQYQDELDRLYPRYRELEEQRKQLLETLSALAQQRSREQYCRSLPERERDAACQAF
jgi:DNA repair exonuclease SbcCD ATPase subunit